MSDYKVRMTGIPSNLILLQPGWYEALEIVEKCGYDYKYVVKSLNRMNLETEYFKGVTRFGHLYNKRKRWYWPGCEEYIRSRQV